jgi:ubiquinone/menaquinone biosynthesis C-methylase UbiE
VDASLYDEAYFLGECEGYAEFAATGGRVLSRRLATALSRADVQPGMRVLDVGCGRGESLVWLMRRGAEAWGLDYATEALGLTTRAVQSAGLEEGVRYCLLAANARRLPFPPDSFDRVLMLDIVEHLQPWELEQALREVGRVLKRGGKLLVHTAPNRWYYQFGYPLFRLAERLRGVRLPRDPRQRFRYHQRVHVNEQSPRSLARALRQVGFRPRVWLEDTQQRWANRNGFVRALGWFVTRCYPFKWVFCGDVLSVADRT